MRTRLPGSAPLLPRLLLVLAWTWPGATGAATVDDAESMLARCQVPGNAADSARQDAMLAVLPTPLPAGTAALSARVADLESRIGPLHPELFPDLMALGLAFNEAGNYRDAATTLRRALFIIRAADGLYSLDQLPVIDVLIQSYAGAGDWRRATDAHDLLEWVYRRNYRADDPRLLPVLGRIRSWHIEVYNRDDGRDLEMHYAAVERAYHEALVILDSCTGERRLSQCFFHAGCCPGAGADAGTCPGDDAQNFAAGLQSK